MADTVTYSQFEPQICGVLRMTTGTLTITTATGGVKHDFTRTVNNVRAVIFEPSAGYTAEYDRVNKVIKCYKPDGTESDSEDLEFNFTLIGQGN